MPKNNSISVHKKAWLPVSQFALKPQMLSKITCQ